MVEWKGGLDGEVGEKARILDRIERFPVPNFFVITAGELRQVFEGKNSSDQILNTTLSPERKNELKDAYKDIGMSSEVRNSTGRAKNLVGGQRNNQLVSIRVSNQSSDSGYSLNTGSSDLFDAIKDVVASYYDDENDFPAVIIQKMVEPEVSGAAMIGDRDSPDLLEVVEGLGVSLEEGENRPYFYTRDSDGIYSRKPSEHLKVTRNPINGHERRKNVDPELPFKDSEVRELLGKLDSEGLNIKFVYKRGDFHVVDAWDEDPNYKVLRNPEMQGLKVSQGDISGTVGREITYSENTLPPEKYEKHLVSRTGGYTSRDAEKAREQGKTAVFSFTEELEQGQRINMKNEDRRQSRMDDRREEEFSFEEDSLGERSERKKNEVDFEEDAIEPVLATEVIPLNPRQGKGVYTSPPYGEGYVLNERASGENEFTRDQYVDSFEKAFRFEADKLMLDVRKMGDEKQQVMDYLEARKKVLICENPDTDVLRNAVRNGFEAVGCEERFVSELESKMLKAEKSFMISKLRELD